MFSFVYNAIYLAENVITICKIDVRNVNDIYAILSNHEIIANVISTDTEGVCKWM